MIRHTITLLVIFLSLGLSVHANEWEVLFDQSTGLKNWKVGENPESVRIEDNLLVLNGKRAHLFYMGEDGKASWKNFEAEVQFKTSKNANSGLFFHTQWQESDWPAFGLECQINVSHEDWRRTGSIFGLEDIRVPGHADGEWVTMVLRVENNTAIVSVNGKETNRWKQPDTHTWKKKRINQGTFAFQAHDPGSKVVVRSFRVRRLP